MRDELSSAKTERETWVDNVKVIACVLVVLGHFFQSLTKADILPENEVYQWFNRTIYYFHVPLFFICSGYLYQKLSKVEDARSWGKNVLKKALNLGVPYFVFSFATWLLKTVFSSSVNDEIGGLFDTLFLHPTSPYWYLYALFFIFLITPTFRIRTAAHAGLIVAIVFKMISIFGGGSIGIQAISYLLSNEIWFVIGMCLSAYNLKDWISKLKIAIPVSAGIIFIILSAAVVAADVNYNLISVILGFIACFSIVAIIMEKYTGTKQTKLFGLFARYTMPIFLMHTLFAAPLRTILFKIGVQNAGVHVVLGIVISFAGPMIAADIMKKTKWLEFFLYPGKFVRV